MGSDFWQKIVDFFHQTHVVEQFRTVDIVGLSTNPWAMVPFFCLIGYLIFKKSWRDIAILAIILGCWWFSGTNYMQSLIVKGEISIDKILPVLGGGAVVVGVVIYLFFGRSD
ncbi:MAG: hypothetical protein P4L42_05765 [Desulfocapsaceae bacterium]|nr:hypothetical protein [Desulfocapsaceae bacterium]